MKINKNILIRVSLILIAVISFSCKDESPKVPSLHDQRVNDLSKTWVLADGISVTLDGSDVSAEYSNFSLTFTGSKSFSSQNGDPIWPSSGDYSFGGTAEVPNLNQLIRSDGISVNITSTNAQLKNGQLTIQFNYVTPTGRLSSPDGSYVMNLRAQ